MVQSCQLGAVLTWGWRLVRATYLAKTAKISSRAAPAAAKAGLNPGGSYVNSIRDFPIGRSMIWKTPSDKPIGTGWLLTVAYHPRMDASSSLLKKPLAIAAIC